MHHSLSIATRVLGLTGLLVAWAPAQEPERKHEAVFSLEVVAVNGNPLPGGPASEISASPGDVLTARIFVRDWSADGVKLRAYQASLDARGYTSGYEGTICAVDFEKTTAVNLENRENAFVDPNDPQFVFFGLQNFAITDSVSASHRWLGALIDTSDSRLAPQDGTKYYCGTVRLKVSDKARGPFTLRLQEAPWASTLRGPENKQVLGLSFEPLKIDVGVLALRILSSDPPSGAIDARSAGGWNRILFRQNGAETEIAKEDFRIDDGTATPPQIKNIQRVGSLITLELDRRITRGIWTTITHISSATGARIAYLPGDVDNDGATTSRDVSTIIDWAKSSNELPLYRADIDGDGAYTVRDAVRLVELLAEPGTYRARLATD